MQIEHPTAHELLREVWHGLGGEESWLERVTFTGEGALPSPFAVTDLAGAVIGAAGAAVAELVATTGATPARVHVDRVLSSGWFHLPDPSKVLRPQAPHPVDWSWLTEFATRDGRWLRAQAIFPTLRARLAKGLGTKEDAAEVAAVIRQHDADEIEQVLVDAGAAVAVNRTLEQWRQHPAGMAVRAEPIVDFSWGASVVSSDWAPTPGRPLAGIKVLDLTRVVAGPMATRYLAACGAEVLRLDAPGSDESTGPTRRGNESMIGKRWAFLDLRTPEGKTRFLDLLSEADILVHGYRPGGIDVLVSPSERFQAKPDLIEVTYNAYGWTGPWKMRRGFDTLVQWSSGISNENQAWGLEAPERRVPLTSIGRKLDASRPRHMPVEALDFGTAYLVAAAAVRGLTQRLLTGKGSVSKLSLARTASILIDKGRVPESRVIELPLDGPWEDRVYVGAKGPLKRLAFPLAIDQNPLFWERAAESVGSSNPVWAS